MHYLPQEIPAIRKAAEKALTPACERTSAWTASMLIDRCIADTAQLWRDGDLWAVTEVRSGVANRMLQVIAMAGVFGTALVQAMEAWGKAQGCDRIYFVGRRGWEKRLPDYQLTSIILEKRF